LKDLLEAGISQRQGREAELDEASEKNAELTKVKFLISYNPIF
jgi:hypothetical protein